MQEEISLRELIEVILKGKKLIVSITVAAILIAAILSYFVIQTTYETTATVQINNLKEEETTPLYANIRQLVSPQVYSERIKSQQVLESVLKNSDLSRWTIEELKRSITVNSEKDSNIVTISLNGENPELIHKTLQAIVIETNNSLGESVSANLMGLAEQYEEQLNIEKENLDKTLKEYNFVRADEGLPTIVLLDAITSGEKQYILNIDDKKLEELKNLDKNKQVEFEKLNNQVNTLTDLYNTYSKNYEEARSMSKLYSIDQKVSVIAEPNLPISPVGPKKVLNMAIGLVVGLMASVGIVFFMHYWRESGKIHK